MNTISAELLVEQATEMIETLSADIAIEAQEQDDAVLVDIRDIRELRKTGAVKGAVHAPRGMLEFWFDPACEYHREVFNQPNKQFVLFCAAGWRSALAAKSLQEMGFENIAHIEGGFGALEAAGATVNILESR